MRRAFASWKDLPATPSKPMFACDATVIETSNTPRPPIRWPRTGKWRKPMKHDKNVKADVVAREMTGGQIIVDHLIREGVTHVFGIPGHGDTALMDAFVDRKDEIQLLPAMHEQNASHMADGFYRSSGKIAAVVTSIG